MSTYHPCFQGVTPLLSAFFYKLTYRMIRYPPLFGVLPSGAIGMKRGLFSTLQDPGCWNLYPYADQVFTTEGLQKGLTRATACPMGGLWMR